MRMKPLYGACVLLSLFFFRGTAAQAQEDSLAATDASGATYSVTGRHNDTNDYLHITKVNDRGNLVWESDYNTGVDEKPVGIAVNSSGIIILATRRLNDSRSFTLIAFSAQNDLIWERASGTQNSVPVALKVDKDDNIYVCGNSRTDNRYSAGLWKFDGNGAQFWYAEYPVAGNSYAQQLQLLFNGDISLGVTVFTGSDNYGQYERRAISYDSAGRQLR